MSNLGMSGDFDIHNFVDAIGGQSDILPDEYDGDFLLDVPPNLITDSSVPFSYFPPGMQNTQGVNTGVQFLHSQQTGPIPTQPVNTNLYQHPQPATPTSPFVYPQQSSPQPHTPILAQQVLKPNVGPSLFNFEDNASRAANGKQTVKTVQQQPQPIAVLPLHYLPEVLEIEKALTAHTEHIEKMRTFQKALMQKPSQEAFNQLYTEQTKMKQANVAYGQELKKLRDTYLLSPHDLHKITLLSNDLAFQEAQLDLFIRERETLTGQPQPLPLASLYIINQPFPSIFMKKKQLIEQEIVHVKILKATNVETKVLSQVKAAIVCHNPYNSKTKKPKPVLDTDSSSVDLLSQTAKFQFTFQSGTRKDIANLRFGVQVDYGAGPVTLESEFSKPLLVMTNESQYGDALKIVFVKDVFANVGEITWNYFANEVQRYFIQATKQDQTRPTRGLSLLDLHYIHQNFFGSASSVNQKNAERFWDWFGKVLRELRYQKNLCAMWKMGFIYGFLHRDLVQRTLINCNPGSFLLRFSESSPGSLTVGYRIPPMPGMDPQQLVGQKAVRNYLIKDDDIMGPKKSLADFLHGRFEFQEIMQYYGEHEADGRPKFRGLPRDEALRQFYSQTATSTGTGSYDDL
jgi:hypothetical protein